MLLYVLSFKCLSRFLFFFLVRQLEQHVKLILDQIGMDEDKKRQLIRGGAVDKAEQLSELKIVTFPCLYKFQKLTFRTSSSHSRKAECFQRCII